MCDVTTKQRVRFFASSSLKCNDKNSNRDFRKAEVNETERKKFEENFKGLRKRSQETRESGFLHLKLKLFSLVLLCCETRLFIYFLKNSSDIPCLNCSVLNALRYWLLNSCVVKRSPSVFWTKLWSVIYYFWWWTATNWEMICLMYTRQENERKWFSENLKLRPPWFILHPLNFRREP